MVWRRGLFISYSRLVCAPFRDQVKFKRIAVCDTGGSNSFPVDHFGDGENDRLVDIIMCLGRLHSKKQRFYLYRNLLLTLKAFINA